MYSPLIGQFAERDPLGYAAGDENLYRYCGNGPTDAVDPSGGRIFFVKEPGMLTPARQGAMPTLKDAKYQNMESSQRARTWAADLLTWKKGGQTPNTITMYVLLRYYVAPDSTKYISAAELKKIAKTHTQILESAINDSSYVHTEGKTSWRVRAKVIIITDKPYLAAENDNDLKNLRWNSKEYLEKSVKFNVHSRSGAFSMVGVTCQDKSGTHADDGYRANLVPAFDPKWKSSTFRDLLVHELIGHGLNNFNEIGADRSALEKQLGVKLPPDAIMSYDASPNKTFYQRNWAAGFQDQSNVPGRNIIPGSPSDNTSNLDLSDPWFSKNIADPSERQPTLDMVKGIIKAAWQ